MLNKFVFCAIIFAISVSAAFAQNDQSNNDEIHKFEVFGGVTAERAIQNSGGQTTYGVEGAFVKNVNRYFGIKGAVTATFRDDAIFFRNGAANGNTQVAETAEISVSNYNFLGGIQFKDNRKEGSRLRPFAHALVGIGINRRNLNSASPNFCDPTVVNCNEFFKDSVGFSASFGGGLDVKLNKRISIRAIQVDYNPTRSNISVQQNVRFSTGIVFH